MAFYNIREYLFAMSVDKSANKQRNEQEGYKSIREEVKYKKKKKEKNGNNGIPWIKKILVLNKKWTNLPNLSLRNN